MACSFRYTSLLLLSLLAPLLPGTACGSPDLKSVDSLESSPGLLKHAEGGSEEHVNWSPLGDNRGVPANLRNANSTLAGEIASTAGDPTRRDLVALGQRLAYFGGSTLSAPKGKIYVIFYGSWPSGRRQPILDFLRALNSKNPKGKGVPSVRDWWQINAKNYFNKRKRFVTGDISVAGTVNLGYSLKPKGTSKSNPLKVSDLQSLVRRSITRGFKVDSNALYLVLTSGNVYVDSFCSYTCSFHSYFTHRGKKLAFSFVGDSSSQCQLYCTYLYLDPSSSTFNGMAVDGMISMIAHELAGMATNMFPGKNSPAGWVVANSQIENTDLCTWVFGQGIQWVKKGNTIFSYNLVGPKNRKYIVQANYNLKTRTCEMRYKGK